MTLFWIAVVCGVAIAITYVALGVRTFARVRRDILSAASSGISDDKVERVPDDLHRGFVWKALGGVGASTLVIVLLGVDSIFWYLPVILALGSAIAVIVAFFIDGRPIAPAGIDD